MPLNLPAPHMVLKNFLSAEDHAALLNWTFANESAFVPAKLTDGTIDRSIKNLNKLYDIGPLKPVFRARIHDEYKSWIRQLKISGFDLGHLELHIAAHPDNAVFGFHLDATVAEQTDTSTRALTGVYYFHREPKAFSGGEIRLYNIGEGPGSDRRVSIEPAQNTLLLFPSWVGHDVTRVSVPSQLFADSRFAVNCWLHRTK